MTVAIHGKNVFDLALPSIAYHDTTDPAEVHRLIRQARAQSPVSAQDLHQCPSHKL